VDTDQANNEHDENRNYSALQKQISCTFTSGHKSNPANFNKKNIELTGCKGNVSN